MSALLTPIELQHPASIHFGPGLAAEVGAFARRSGCTRVLVVADAFNASRIGLLGLPGSPVVFGEVRPEPDIPNLDALLALAEQTKPDLVVGFGGGSAMDLAKLAAVLPGSGQTIHDVAGAEKVSGRRCALAQVPTTSGTGSEAGTRALITDPSAQNKIAVQSRHMLADIAVVDPDLTRTVPAPVTAATGVDALAHCAEAYTSRKAHPLIDLYALEGIRLVGRFLGRAVRDGNDGEARAGLSLASLYGCFCLGPVNTTAGHAVAYPLGTRHHIPHGLACALIFPHTLAFNAAAVSEKTARILDALGGAGVQGEDGVRAAARGFCESLGIDMRLSRHGVPEGDLETMAADAHAIRRLLDNNPREMSRDDILALYRVAF
jgi:alcohol dehydrogenase class IV